MSRGRFQRQPPPTSLVRLLDLSQPLSERLSIASPKESLL
jgi:hypothetical protein